MKSPSPRVKEDCSMRKRLDLVLVEMGLVPSRARAQATIRAGKVRVAGAVVLKPAYEVDPQADILLEGLDHPYVSRAALKLVHALDHSGVSPEGLYCLDIGASTGGFTQVLLQRGAAHVVALDVGHGQLAPEVGNDSRVLSLEGFNAKDLTRDMLTVPPRMLVSDVSFISLKKALPAALALAAPGAILVALIKPQFEAGRERVGRGGIVRDPVIHDEICADISRWLTDDQGWRVEDLTPSPIEGGDGNREFLIVAVKDA